MDGNLMRFLQLVKDDEVNLNCFESSTHKTPLLLLAYNNQSDGLIKLVELLFQSQRVFVNAKDTNFNWNALPTVCFHYRGAHLLEIVRLLVHHRIDVTSTSAYGWNALFALTSTVKGVLLDPRLLEIVKTLVDAGLDVNAKTNDGLNVLVPLTESYHHHSDFVGIVKFLVEKGLDLNVKNSRTGRNALIILCDSFANDSSLFSIVRLLIDCGIDYQSKDNDGLSAVDVLKRHGLEDNSKAIQLLLQSH